MSHLELNASDKQQEVDTKQAGYERANNGPLGLAYLLTAFDAVNQAIKEITPTLGLLADVWQEVLIFTQFKVFPFY